MHTDGWVRVSRRHLEGGAVDGGVGLGLFLHLV